MAVRDEVSQTKTVAAYRLLAEHRQTGAVSQHDVVAIGMSIDQQKEGMSTISPFGLGDKDLGLASDPSLLGLVFQLPGEVEVSPVDVWAHIADVVGEYHLKVNG
jgi:hypothetical protein